MEEISFASVLQTSFSEIKQQYFVVSHDKVVFVATTAVASIRVHNKYKYITFIS